MNKNPKTTESSKLIGGSSSSTPAKTNAGNTTQSGTPNSDRVLFDIWEEHDIYASVSWRAKMVNYTAHFKTKEQAELYVKGVKIYRDKAGTLVLGIYIGATHAR